MDQSASLSAQPTEAQTPDASSSEDTMASNESRTEAADDGGPVVSLGPNLTVAASAESNIRRLFMSASASMQPLAMSEFSALLTNAGAKREYCTQFFKAFDRNNDGVIDYDEFLIGMVAMDNETYHGGPWYASFALYHPVRLDRSSSSAKHFECTYCVNRGEQRAHYIFRTYDLNGDGGLDYGEMLHLVRHLRRGRGQSESVSEIETQSRALVEELGTDGVVSLDSWLAAVGSKRVRGTSKLFRLSVPLLKPSSPATHAPEPEAHTEPQRLPEPVERPRLLQVHLAHTAIKAEQEESGKLTRAMSETHGTMAVGRVKHISPCLVGVPTGEEPSLGVAMHIVETLVLDDAWQRTEMFCPQIVAISDLKQLLQQAIAILQTEATVVELPAPCKVFGDIHGQFTDLKKFFATYGSPNHRTGDVTLCQYVFIGDFVDRGACSLETVCSLLALKVRYPTRVTLIRGNHEDRGINAQYGFREECIERCGVGGEELWESINDVFDWLPLAASIEGQILCLHGGPGAHVNTVDDIRRIERPIRLGTDDDVMTPMLWDILWSDPTEDDSVLGILSNVQRGGSGNNICKYGPDRVKTFCEKAGLKLVIRAHECVQDGYQYFASCHLITVFSATNYCARHGNDGAFLEIALDREQLNVVPKVIKAKPSPETAQGYWRKKQYRPPSPVRRRGPAVPE